MKLEVRVQHHPSRPQLVEPLLAKLPADARVIAADPDLRPDPWRDYRRCLESAEDGSHLLILQDDVILCEHFIEAAQLAIAARPELPVCFCVCGAPRNAAHALLREALRGRSWVMLASMHFVPVIALAWPRELIQPCLDYVDAQTWPAEFKADDEIVGRAFRQKGIAVNATVPSLADHDDTLDSVIRAWYKPPCPERRAVCFIDDEECDPREIAW